MEEMMGFDERAQLIKELLEGEEIAKELRNHILRDNNQDLCNSLLEKMLSTFDKTITMAKLLSIQVNQDHTSIIHTNNSIPLGSSPLSNLSPNSENSHPNFPPLKRRRSMETKWTNTVQISNNGSLEGVLNDGFSWRKYGQKDILGAKFPRGYYRCTYRHSKGCNATKQVQRSNEDQSIYQIMYKGDHTCSQGVQIKDDKNSTIRAQLKLKSELQPQPQPQPQTQLQQPQSPQQDVFVGLASEGDIKVESEDELINRAQIFRSFSFTQAHLQPDSIEDNYMLSFCPSFGSPTTSSNCLPVSPFHSTETHEGLSVQTQEIDFNEAVSGIGSVINTPMMGVSHDLQLSLDDWLDLCDNFSFDQI